MNPYSFQAYKQQQSQSWLSTEEIRVLTRISANQFDPKQPEIASFLEKNSHTWRELADQSALEEPKLVSYNAYNQRQDQVKMPDKSQRLMEEVYHFRPFSKKHPFWYRYFCNYFLSKNGEAGVCCSIACTDGMVQALHEFPNEQIRPISEWLEEGKAGRYVHGAQFVTEIQGGSDAGKNIVSAKAQTPQTYLLTGEKWFCSNVIADYFLVTARPEGSPEGPKGIALFLVPAYSENGLRNGYQIRRLKNKLGTRNLPTVELCFDGAIAYPVGPLEKGLSNMIRLVITCSRVHAALTSSGFLQRVIADVTQYTKFREVFGKPIQSYPLAQRDLKAIQHAANRQMAGSFEIIARRWLKAPHSDPQIARKEQLALRVLIMLNKMGVTRESAESIHRAIHLYAGNGIEFEFSPTPRLLTDAIINEVWEGPHHLLITNAFEDLKTVGLTAEEFITFAQVKPEEEKDLTNELKRCLKEPKAEEGLQQFESVALKVLRSFQERALA